MELHELLDRLVSALERLQIPYLITGRCGYGVR